MAKRPKGGRVTAKQEFKLSDHAPSDPAEFWPWYLRFFEKHTIIRPRGKPPFIAPILRDPPTRPVLNRETHLVND